MGALCVLVAVYFVFKPSEGTGQASNCVDGFMSRDRMGMVLDNYRVGAVYNQHAIIPDMNFTCDGQIRELILAAQWRNQNGEFPEIQIWRPTNDSSVYNTVGSVTINVTQSSPTLLYQFPLSSMLQFENGDVIGFYQPIDQNSRLRLQLAVRRPTPLQTIYYNNGNPGETSTISNERTNSRNLILAVITDSTDCTHGFMSNETMYSLLGLVGVGRLVGRVERQQITPDMKFTCDGVITKWIIGALWNRSDHLFPELQIWRDVGNDTFRKIAGTMINVEEQNSSLIYEYSNFTPIPFEAGDMFGAFVPVGSDSKIRLRAENNNGPLNYYITTDTAVEEVITTAVDYKSDIYHPLVTVEISVSESTTNVMSIFSSAGSSNSKLYSTSNSPLLPSSNPTSTGASFTTSSVHSSQHMSPSSYSLTVTTASQSVVSSMQTRGNEAKPAESETQSRLEPVVGGVVGGVLVLVGIVLCVSIVGIIVWKRRRNTSKVILQQIDTHTTNLENPLYADIRNDSNMIHGNKSTLEQGGILNSTYTDYDSVASGHTTRRKETLEFDNPLYSNTGPVTLSESDIYESSDFGASREYFYVPTIVQRQLMDKNRAESSATYASTSDHNTVEYEESKEYAYATTGAIDRGNEYFEEENIYWTPATTVPDLYEQLSHHKFREILRQHIEVGGSLGSGQFGVVSRGKWHTTLSGQPLEVAIKTLRPEAKETEKLKFLQEAAINGQFKHPNIVKLHGVVTMGEPVMIVLEYLSNGDLREYLKSIISQPNPPEQKELSELCLSFTQQVASGMSYLAGKDFVHRDLAARNILVSEDTVCKVADFGMARDLDEASYYVSHGGKIPVKWTAPEALHYKKYSTASDVWSFGCLMYEIWSLGHKPFEGYTNSQVLNLVTEGYRLSPPPGCPRQIYSIMISCWNPEGSSRPSFQSLCNTLTENSAALLQWREDDNQFHPQANSLGGPLEAGKMLYSELQETYVQNK